MQELLIENIRTDNGVQSRAKINEEYVAELADNLKAGAKLPPIDVFHDGSEYWASDGFHRIMAHVRCGKRTIKSTVHKGTHDDAVWASCSANQVHGLRRDNVDKNHAVRMALKIHPEQSDRAIAVHVGVSNTMVSSARKHVSTVDTSTPPAPRIGRDGKKYPPPPPPTTPKPPAPKSKDVSKDYEGHVIPDHLVSVFERELEINALLSTLSGVTATLNKAQVSGDVLFGDVNFQQALAALKTAYDTVKATAPYSVCPWCHGLTMDTCKGCGKRGFVGKYRWDNTVPAELRH